MERAAWTEERLDDLKDRMDVGFERVDRDIRDLRADLGGQIAEVRGRLDRLTVALIVGLIGMTATLVATILATS